MNKIFVPLLLVLFVSNNSFASVFYPWSCEYEYLAPDWHFLTAKSNIHSTNMDWNQTGGISKSLIKGNQSGELGVCSYIVSNGYQLSISIMFVEGLNLDMPTSSGCEYSGDKVNFYLVHTPVNGNPAYAFSRKKVAFDGIESEYLIIKGISPTALVTDMGGEALNNTCQQAFTAITGTNRVVPSGINSKVKRIESKDQGNRSVM